MTNQTLNKAIEKLAKTIDKSVEQVKKELQAKNDFTWYLLEEVAKSI